MMALAIFLSYALQFYVALDIVLPFFARRFPSRPRVTEFAVRYVLVAITCEDLECVIAVFFTLRLSCFGKF